MSEPPLPAALLIAYDLDPALRPAEGLRALRTVLGRWGRTVSDPARLVVTIGIGPSLPARLGATGPSALRELPAFPGDRLDPASGGGDVIVQLTATDRHLAADVAGRLARAAAGTLRPRWRQRGHLPPTPAGETPRNPLGFKDGTVNPTIAEHDRWVWTGDATYLVVRRIRLHVADFSRLPLERQERIIGRRRADGAPLGSEREHDEVDLFEKTPEGRYVVPLHSHVRVASPRLDSGARMLRRSYSYDNGSLDQGILFLAFMRDPSLFVRVQQRLAVQDDLSRFSEHRASAVAYILPGAAPGETPAVRLPF